jgi:transcriptional regulator with XRE-family HTH domain
MTAATLLRQVRRARGFSQRELARVAKTSQPAIADIERSAHDPGFSGFNRLIVATGHSLTCLPTTAWTVARWADEIYRECRKPHPRESDVFRMLIGASDGLRVAEPSLRVALCVAEPAPCGDQRFDAALAAVVDHHLSSDGLPIPPWVNGSSRFLRELWRATPDVEAEELLPAFSSRGILLAQSELTNV